MSKSARISAGAKKRLTSTAAVRSQKPYRLARKSKTGSASLDLQPTYSARSQLISAQAESPAYVSAQPRKPALGKSIRSKSSDPLARKAVQPNEEVREEIIGDGNIAAPATMCSQTKHRMPGIYQEIRTLWRYRQNWHRAEKSLVIQARSICMAYVGARKNTEGKADKKALKAAEDAYKLASEFSHTDIRLNAVIAPFVAAAQNFESERVSIEKDLAKLVRNLPIYTWAKGIYGLGDLGLASIIGEIGDASRFSTVSKLWKYCGLAVLDGERQRKCSNADKAILHRYSPQRRSVFWNISNGLVGGMGHGPRPLVGEDVSASQHYSPYQKLFIKRMREKCGLIPGECTVREDWKRASIKKKDGLHESFSQHAAADAKRYVLKRFLRDLWVKQREILRDENQTDIRASARGNQASQSSTTNELEKDSKEIRRVAKRSSVCGRSQFSRSEVEKQRRDQEPIQGHGLQEIPASSRQDRAQSCLRSEA